MRNILFIAFWFGIALHVKAQTSSQAETPIQSLVNAELAFAKLVSDKNAHDAFLANIDDESVGIEKNSIIKLKTQWQERKPDGSLLTWQPVYADISSSGDFGFTTGPWQYRTLKTVDPSVFGEYVTVWRKHQDGQWKIISDFGIKHNQTENNRALAYSSIILKKPSKLEAKDFKTELMNLDKEYTKLTSSPQEKNYSKDLQVLREGKLPIINTDEIKKQFQTDAASKVVCNPLDAYVAPSGDLGFVIGAVSAEVKLANTTEKKNGKYLRIWKKEDGKTWKMVLDLISY
jgi:ketosteroid isomerase-like protein